MYKTTLEEKIHLHLDGGYSRINHGCKKHRLHKAWVNTIKGRAALVNYRTPAREKRNSSDCFKKNEKKRQIGFIRLSFSTHHFQNPSFGRCLKWSHMNPSKQTNLITKGRFHFKVDLSSKGKTPLEMNLDRQNQTISNFSLHQL